MNKDLEQKIHIAAGYDAERVGLIKELLIEVAIGAFDAGFKVRQQGILIKNIEFKNQKEQFINNLKIDLNQ